MAMRISRRKLAEYFVDEFMAGEKDIVLQLAAFLVQSKRTRELPIIIRDIEYRLAKRGDVIVDVTSARPLDKSSEKAIQTLTRKLQPKSSVHLRTRIDPSVIGGIRVEMLARVLDATIQHKLQMLKADKV